MGEGSSSFNLDEQKGIFIGGLKILLDSRRVIIVMGTAGGDASFSQGRIFGVGHSLFDHF